MASAPAAANDDVLTVWQKRLPDGTEVALIIIGGRRQIRDCNDLAELLDLWDSAVQTLHTRGGDSHVNKELPF